MKASRPPFSGQTLWPPRHTLARSGTRVDPSARWPVAKPNNQLANWQTHYQYFTNSELPISTTNSARETYTIWKFKLTRRDFQTQWLAATWPGGLKTRWLAQAAAQDGPGRAASSAVTDWSAGSTPAAPMARWPGGNLNVRGTAEVRTMRGTLLAGGLSIGSQRLWVVQTWTSVMVHGSGPEQPLSYKGEPARGSCREMPAPGPEQPSRLPTSSTRWFLRVLCGCSPGTDSESFKYRRFRQSGPRPESGQGTALACPARPDSIMSESKLENVKPVDVWWEMFLNSSNQTRASFQVAGGGGELSHWHTCAGKHLPSWKVLYNIWTGILGAAL